MSYRKRRASDELLPTTRPAKVPRAHHNYLHSSAEDIALAQPEALGTRWVQVAEELCQLVGDTTAVMLGTFFRGVGGFLTRTLSDQDYDDVSLPQAPSQESRPPPSPSPSVQEVSPPLPPPPRRRTTFHANAVASSSHQNEWPQDRQNTGLLTPPPSQTSSNSSSTSFVGPHHEESKHPQIAATRRVQGYSKFPARQFPPTRRHIFDRQHKRNVKEDRIKSREEMEDELYQLRRQRGYKSDKPTFVGWLRYKESLERMQKLEALQPSPSLVDLHVSEPFPELARSQSAPQHASVEFVRRALLNVKETLKSKPQPVYSPSLDKLRFSKLLKAQELEDRLRPKRKPLPTSLPPSDEAAVDDLLRKHGIISKCVREQVSDSDLKRLRPGHWLNDEVINFYGQMILSRSEESRKAANKENKATSGAPLNVHYFSTFFWSKLSTEGYEKGRLAKWTKKFDIFSKDVVLIPVNHNNSHWTAAAINFRQKRIESYDSMGMPRQNVYSVLRAYLDAEHRNKKKTPFDFTGWQDYVLEDVPQQENGYDCGVFTCQFLESLSRGEESFAFTQSDMAYLRRRMIWEIGHAKLRGDT